MMMEPIHDPYDILFGDEQKSPSSELMFANEIMLSDFNNDPLSISPIHNTTDYTENYFDETVFEDLVNKLFSSDPLLLKEHSIDLSFPSIESEPLTREMGTDPMESVPSTLPIIIKTSNVNNLTDKSIFLIQTMNKTPAESVPIQTTVPVEYFDFPTESSSITTNDYQMEDNLPLTPSSSSESPDETSSNSPDNLQNNAYSTMLTNFDNLPSSGSLVLTNEELKLLKQEGYQVPTKLPLNKNEEKILKKIRRKIKNKISAQESRRKKKEYVDELEKQIKKYIDENSSLKQRMTVIEKSQKTLTQERDLLRSMMGKATTPAPSTALMVFAVFFAVLFGIWSPITTKTSIDDKSLSLLPSSNYQSPLTTQKSIFEQQETTHSNNHKSRVLLSIDEYDNHHHGPYLPSNNKYKSQIQHQTAAPGYTYSNTIEKYMNKKVSNTNLKRSFIDESPSINFTEESTYKKLRSNYHIIEETNTELDNEFNENKSVKIIRVERTIPTISNDTLKLAHPYNK